MFNSKNRHTEVKHVDWLPRITTALKGLVVGVFILFAAFFLLIWNEGKSDVNQLAENAIYIDSMTSSNQHIGQLVTTTGLISSNELLSDNLFLKPSPFIALARAVEMYAWEERRQTDTETHLGGSETQKITATYTQRWIPAEELNKDWTSMSDNNLSIVRSTKSSSFLQPENHQNPPLIVDNAGYKVSTANVGIYNLDMASFKSPFYGNVDEAFRSRIMTGFVELLTPTPVQPTPQNINLSENTSLSGEYLYNGTGSLKSPKLGDLRIRYAALEANTNVTVIGKLDSDRRIGPYVHRNNHRLYRIIPGTTEQAITRIKTEDSYFSWLLRLLGFILIWFSLRLIVEPISILLDFFPIFGAFSRVITGYATLLMALSLTLVTILVYQFTSNFSLWAIAIFATFVAMSILLIKMRRPKSS